MAQDFRLSDKGLSLIQEFEGCDEGRLDGDRWQAYLDTIAQPPVWTIYFGLTKGVSSGMIITRAEGDEMMRRELIQCETAVEDAVKVSLNQNQVDALTSFSYNCGTGALRSSTLLKLINQGKFEAAAAQFVRWNKCGGKPINGLTRRRKREAAKFMEPMPLPAGAPAEPMPQSVDAAAPATSTLQVIKSSPTIGATGIGLAAGITQAASGLWSWITDAGQQIGAAKEASGPFGELFKALHINFETVTLTVIIGALLFAGIRHIVQKREGLA